MQKYIAALALFVPAMASAQAGGPPIAYVSAGTKGDSIYLVYPDGTGLTKSYQAPSSGRAVSRIDRVSLSPVGDEVAFIQDSSRLLIQKVDGGGRPTGAPREVDAGSTACALYDPDYRSDGALIFTRNCTGPDTRVVARGGVTSSRLFLPDRDIAGEAALGTDLVYVDIVGGTTNAARLVRRPAGGSATVIASTTFQFPYFVDATGSRAVLSDPRGSRSINLSTGAETPGCTPADLVKLSPDGSKMLYRFRDILFVHNADCSGAPFRLTRGVKSAAWRSN